MDPSPTPWRTIETAVPAPTEPAQSGAAARLPLGALAIAGAAGLVLVAAFLLAFGTGTSGAVEVQGASALESPSSDGAARGGAGASLAVGDVGPDLVVEVVGAVVQPGVYHLAPGSRVGDLVLAAGGYGARVDADAASRVLNLAARLKDGDQVRVPSRDDTVASPGTAGGGAGEPAGGGGAGAAAVVDLNAATSTELEALPGIGPATAAKIIAAREEARFTTVDDLRTRKLLGQKTFDSLRDLVTVR
jgi:competence protein ComEA